MFKKSVLIISTLLSLSALAADLYVSPLGNDGNSGAAEAPFKTIQQAANSAKAGTTVHVAPGTYQETITSTNSGTSTARIKYLSDVKWGAKLIPASGARTMWDVSGGYIDIIGFEVDGTGGDNVRLGVAFSGGNSTMQNSHVHHVAMNSGCDNLGGAGVWAGQHRGVNYNNYDFIGNVIHHVGGGCGYIQGIYHQSSGNIKNNVIYATSSAIHLYHDDHDVNIVNNTLFGNSNYAIIYGGCQESYTNPCPTKGIRVYNNIVYDNVGGIQGPVTSEDVDNVVKNNLVYKNIYQFDLASPSSSTRSGEVIADPQFVNYKRDGGGDYHLKNTSPAINKGLSSLAPATDIDGNLRNDGAIDMGAYEYGATAINTPAPILSVSTKSVTFPNQIVGSTSSAQLITVTNTGNAPLVLNPVFEISGDFQFAGTGTCSSSVSYAPGSNCVVSVLFKPIAAGLRVGSLKLSSMDGQLSSVIALSGNAVLQTPAISPSASLMNFGSVRVGRSSSVKYLTITNTGNAQLSLGQKSISGNFQNANVGTCKSVLAAGAKCTYSVKFVPKIYGTNSGVMSIPSNASTSVLKIQLTGTGTR